MPPKNTEEYKYLIASDGPVAVRLSKLKAMLSDLSAAEKEQGEALNDVESGLQNQQRELASNLTTLYGTLSAFKEDDQQYSFILLGLGVVVLVSVSAMFCILSFYGVSTGFLQVCLKVLLNAFDEVYLFVDVFL